MTARLVTVSWTTETGHATRFHAIHEGDDATLCGFWPLPNGPGVKLTYGEYPQSEVETCVYCLRKLKKGGEAMEASR